MRQNGTKKIRRVNLHTMSKVDVGEGPFLEWGHPCRVAHCQDERCTVLVCWGESREKVVANKDFWFLLTLKRGKGKVSVGSGSCCHVQCT